MKNVTYMIKVDEQDVNVLERAQTEENIYSDCIQSALTNEKAAPNMVERFVKKLADAKLTFTKAKHDVEVKYLPADLVDKHQYDWNIDYRTHEMRITVKCECGRKVLDDAGVSYEEVEAVEAGTPDSTVVQIG